MCLSECVWLTMQTSKEQRRCLSNCVLCNVSYHTGVCVWVCLGGWFTLIYMEQQRNTECSFSHNAPKGTTFAHIPLWEHIALAVGKWVLIKLGVTLRPALLMKKEWKTRSWSLACHRQHKPNRKRSEHITPNHNAVHLLPNRPHSTNNNLLNSLDF